MPPRNPSDSAAPSPAAPDWDLIDEISAQMRVRRPVFIAGCNRSGTSVLRHTLERHTRFQSKNPRSPETRAFTRPRRILQLREKKARTLRRFLSDDPADWEELLAVLGDEKAWPEERYVDLLRVYFHRAWALRGVERLLEKTPRHVFHLDRVFEAFPESQVVLCIRHPIDVYSSLRKRRLQREAAGRAPAEGGWQHLTPEAFAALYGEITEIVAQRRSGDPRCFVQRYEDLSGDPVASLAALGAFLDVELDAGALFPSSEDAPDLRTGPAPAAPIAANPKQWNDFISPAEARSIEDSLGASLGTHGYERYT